LGCVFLQPNFSSSFAVREIVCGHQAQQVSQRDAPPVGGFEIWFLSRFCGFALLSLAARPCFNLVKSKKFVISQTITRTNVSSFNNKKSLTSCIFYFSVSLVFRDRA